MFTPLQAESLNAVFKMFQDMHISTQTASALVKVLCSDRTVSRETRATLVNLHERYVRLEELIDSSSNYEFDKRILQTKIHEIGLQFRLCLLKLLPACLSVDELVKDIAQYQLTVDKYAVKHNMLNSSNLTLTGPRGGGLHVNVNVDNVNDLPHTTPVPHTPPQIEPHIVSEAHSETSIQTHRESLNSA